MAIDAVSSAIAPAGLPAATAAPAPAGGGFTESLGRLLQATESAGQEANASVAGMLDGTRDVHDAMIALQQADLMLQLTVQVRNKIVQAYQDIMRMPV